ncbi:MAG: FAD-dependent oxidoreductase [Ketobacteraceae bacterium]|nr:FAD-dependent oxidoreductase [Ketobacteraceae bacterium]
MARKRIGIIGSGISGLTCAYLLNQKYDITLIEQNEKLGGHTNTEIVEREGQLFPVNTGFIVFNDWTYPNFIKLLDRLGVKSETSDMSFSVKCELSGLEYNGTSLNTLFAQRKNLFSPSFWRMIRDILRFNRETIRELEAGILSETETLTQYLHRNRYSEIFIEKFIVPMGAAIWSSGRAAMDEFPIYFFVRFFKNHGMLSVDNRPTWRVISGGSATYIEAMTQSFKDKIILTEGAKSVSRSDEAVIVTTTEGNLHYFDEVIFATHSDQALRLLENPTEDEKQVLGSIEYQDNEVVLHTDHTLLPKSRLAWASWNYHIPKQVSDRVAVTYNMNMLQNFHTRDTTFCVTLNKTQDIAPDKIIKTFNYAHPVFTTEAVAAQKRFDDISGKHRTHFCGAYWFNGFHEDGVKSALRVCDAFGVSL